MNCRFLYCALHGLPWTVFRGHSRTSTYLADTVRTLANITNNFRAGETYNIGGTDLHTIEQLSDVVLKVTGADPKLVHHQETEILTTKLKRVDTSKSVRDLDHKNSYSLEDGMRLTADWMRHVYRVMNFQRLVYVGDVPVEASYHGSALLHRLLSDYPPGRLTIIETATESQPQRRLPNINYISHPIGKPRWLNTRFHPYAVAWYTHAAQRMGQQISQSLNGFACEGVLTVAHGFGWLAAAEIAKTTKSAAAFDGP